ncbi:phosphatase [Pseudoalteromonas ruthenica]|uniref:Phosphatase n=1 Tax=Pseudoalteromonas ruthenica TaxID=151081 RepID=A0A0F4PRN7_9GAMM|nr:phosphatase [Pseudoalteromonas ruthenica]KJY97799.1 phosphatase [Pseudoalteromonas ruthenica]KJZ01826.1 phosphatase [Pseudoalteromonas ruthenica]
MHTNDVTTFAAVDLGSNSFHLLLAREVDGRLEVLHKEKQRVYLAAGLDNNDCLSDEAIERAVSVLRQFARTLIDFPAANVKVVATYTLRRARNIKSFMRRARSEFPFHIDVISGQEEARLIYQGVAQHVHHEGLRLVIDIGGGSTELAIGEHHQHLRLSSRNMGCVSYSQQFFADGRISKKRFKRAIVKAEQELESIANSFTQLGWQHVLATSGTAKMLSALCHQGDLTQPLTQSALAKAIEASCDSGHIERLEFAELSEERRPTFCGGLAILYAVMTFFDIDALTYCDFSLREGILYELTELHAHKDIRVATIANISTRYVIDSEHAANVSATLQWLFPQIEQPWQLTHEDDLPVLLWAAQLHEVGLSINSSGLHKHSAYIIANSQLPGFTQEQQQLLACLIRFYRKKIKLKALPEFIALPSLTLKRMIALFRLAVLMNQKRQAKQKPDYKISAESNALTLQFGKQWLSDNTLLAADLEAEQQQWKKLGLDLHVF